MAHELCHLLHDAGEQDLETRLSGNDSSFDDLVEKRARAFAPSFLAPRDEVRLWFDQGGGKHLSASRNKVLALARRWGLSWQGAVWHAKNCDLISPAKAESLQSEAERQEWQDDFERRQPPPGHPTTIAGTAISSLCRGKLSDLVLEALEAGAISRGRALEIVTWS
jgi:Zn-dependent peptidase ImmA (M78 family)